MNIDPLRPYLDLVKAGAALALLTAAFIGGCNHGKRAGVAEVRELKLQHAKDARRVANLATAAVQAARAAERTQAEAFLAIGEAYEKGKDHAFQRGQDAAAAVRTGTVQLRDHWDCPAARVPEAVAGTGQRDEGAELRATGAGDLVQVGADADAQLRACQAVVVALGGAPRGLDGKTQDPPTQRADAGVAPEDGKPGKLARR